MRENDPRPIAIYYRVSTDKRQDDEKKQDLDNQKHGVRQAISHRFPNVVEFEEKVSGIKHADKRSEFQKMLTGMRHGEYKAIVGWDFSRFGRSPSEMVNLCYELRARQVDFISVSEGVDTSTPMGEIFFLIIVALNKMKWNNTSESVKRYIRFRREQGLPVGRARKEVNIVALKSMRESGASLRACAAAFGINKTTVKNILNPKSVANPT